MSPVTRSQAKKVQAVEHTVDARGSPIKIVPSATGQGKRTVWIYPAIETTESAKPRRANMSAWPTLSSLSSLSESVLNIESDRPKTPAPRDSWTAGSVIMTPKKLQRSPDRIGGYGIDFWRNGSGVIVRDIVDGAGVSQNSQNNRGRSDTDGEQSGVDSRDYMQQMRLLLERREAELAAWVAAQPDERGSMDDGARRLGPEGTVLISENASSYEGDTDMESDGEELTVLQHRQNLRARALGLEPTVIIGPEQYQPPRCTLPSWNLINQGGEPAERLLGLEPTELVL
jgi:hypothetical protein